MIPQDRSNRQIFLLLLFAAAAIAVTLFVRRFDILSGVLLDTKTVNDEDYQIGDQIGVGEEVSVSGNEHALLTCADTLDADQMLSPLDLQIPGLKLYEYTNGFGQEKSENWNGKHFGYEPTDTLTALSPGKTYYAQAPQSFSFRCSAYACGDGIDNDGDGLADGLDPGCSDTNDNDETNSSSCTQQIIWQLGKFDYNKPTITGNEIPPFLSIADAGAAEFPADDKFYSSFTHIAQQGVDLNPQIPSFFSTNNLSDIDGTPRRLNDAVNGLIIEFNLPAASEETNVVWSRYGSEDNELLFDNNSVRINSGSEDGNTLVVEPIGTVSGGDHKVTLIYRGGGSENGNFLDAIALVGCLPPVVEPDVPPFAALLLSNGETVTQLTNEGKTTLLDQTDGINEIEHAAVDRINNRIYWSSELIGTDSIFSANADAQATGMTELLTATGNIMDIAVHTGTGKIFWIEQNENAIYRANDDGTNAELIISSGSLTAPGGIAIDETNDTLYFTDNDSIYRADIDGSNITTVIDGDGNLLELTKIVYHNDKLYFIDEQSSSTQSAIYRIDTNGSNLELVASDSTLFINSLYFDDLAVDIGDDKLYWIRTTGLFGGAREIHQAELDGSQRVRILREPDAASANAFRTIDILEPLIPLLP